MFDSSSANKNDIKELSWSQMIVHSQGNKMKCSTVVLVLQILWMYADIGLDIWSVYKFHESAVQVYLMILKLFLN